MLNFVIYLLIPVGVAIVAYFAGAYRNYDAGWQDGWAAGSGNTTDEDPHIGVGA